MKKMLLFILVGIAVETRGNHAVLGTCFGMSIGTLIGVAMGNLTILRISLCLGACIGMAVGTAIKKK